MALDTDIMVLAQTLYGETRGESYRGKACVASVILNRARDKRWPNTVALVCKQPWQFSCWNANDPNKPIIEKLGLKDLSSNRAFRQCYAVAVSVLEGLVPDLTGGANHYFNPKVVDPPWAKGKTPTHVEGNHTFLNL